MHLRKDHADGTIKELRQLIRDQPLGVLTTAIPSDEYPFIQSSHIPFLLDVQDENSNTELGVLRGHMARANHQSKVMIQDVASRKPDSDKSAGFVEREVLVLFTSNAHAYLTPKWYIETKPATGKVVPTWDYSAAQVYGRAKIYYDTHSEETNSYLCKALDDLSHYSEEQIMGFTGKDGQKSAWQITDAPKPYFNAKLMGIIGVEIHIDRLEGKFKMSQEVSAGDRKGVVEGYRSMNTQTGDDIASTVEQRAELKAERSAMPVK